MKKYIIKRLLQLIPILIGITLLTFVLMNASSTDAVDVMEQNTGTSWTEEQKQAVRVELGLDLSDDHIYFADRIIVYSTGNFVGSAKK